MRIGSDTGGTFTDLVAADGTVVKVPSTPDDPSRAVAAGIDRVVGGSSGVSSGASSAVSSAVRVELVHGTTVATNTVLEHTGAVVTLVTNAGFEDVIEIARQDRPSLYDIHADRPPPLVDRTRRVGVSGRLAADGTVIDAVDPVAAVAATVAATSGVVGPRVTQAGGAGAPTGGPVETGSAGQGTGVTESSTGAAVAVCLLHSDVAGDHEAAVAAALRHAGFDVTASHELAPEMREYERLSTTVLNAYLRPRCRQYVARLAGVAGRVEVLTSAGGLVPLAVAADDPARLLLSGPAGGVAAAAAAARANGFPDAVTFDMGGTSTDVCLVLDGRVAPASEREVGGYPVRLPSVDIHTVGSGGGSIATVDAGGALVVGPRSAGAVPGPACYGLGGTDATVTDADLVLGHLPVGVELPGIGRLDAPAAAAALAGAGVTAEGVVLVVDAQMEEAIREVSVQRGVDPRGLALVAFGGAGPLHACALADALGMPAVVVPARAGVLSAVGVLTAPSVRSLVRTWRGGTDHAGLHTTAAALGAEAMAGLRADGSRAVVSGEVVSGASAGPARVAEPAAVELAVDCRYPGQSHELRVVLGEGWEAAFHDEHERRNGYARRGEPVEVVAVRATASRPAPVGLDDLPVPERSGGEGPLVITEPDCTIWVPEGWRAEVGVAGALVLRRVDGGAPPDPNGSSSPSPARGSGSRTVGPHEVARTGGPRVHMRTGDTPEPEGEGFELDAASLQILLARLAGVAAEMSAVLRRASYSPNIKERADCSSAVFTADGELLAQAENIPVHLGAMPTSVAAVIAAIADGLAVGPDDQVIVNDPFAGGTHLNDITVVAPVHDDGGARIGWVANRAHHADVGGTAPGSMPADARTIDEEGWRTGPAVVTDEVVASLLAASRTPEERRGDLAAQLGANRVGAARLAAMAGAPFAAVVAYGERRVRAELASFPDGAWTFGDVIDSFGPAGDQQEPTAICVNVRIEGDEVWFDFTGSGPERSGNVNAPEAVTVSAAAFALRSVLDPTVPANGGVLRALHVIAPSGTIVNARPPVAVGAGNVEVSQRVADVCFGALAQAVPDRVGAANQGTMNNLILGGADPANWVYYETIGGGQGGRPFAPGMNGIHTCMTNTKNTPIEALERAFPLRVLRQRLRRGSGGAGSAPGGEGIERDLQVLVDATVSVITERRVSQPWGLAGGEPGAVGENWLLPNGDESRAERLPDKCTIQLKAGDVLRMLTPGGGGWGVPRSR